nr:WhiB family transcriptional regulator [Motilibacter deserti]
MHEIEEPLTLGRLEDVSWGAPAAVDAGPDPLADTVGDALVDAGPAARPELREVADVTLSAADPLALVELTADEQDEELRWQERALCAQTDPEAFFPEKGGSTREAKKVCLSCEVRSECLDYALAHDERFGIWGGLSERERRKLRRQAV